MLKPQENRNDRRHFHWRFGRPDHHERDEAALDPALEGKARRGRAGGLQRQPHSPTWRRHRGAEPELVRAKHRARRQDVQRWVQHPVRRYLAATLDGFVNDLDAVFEAKFMLPWSFSEEAAAEKHMAQLQHNMWVTNARSAALSIITGGGKWIEMTIPADALYQHFLVTAERRFWRCVQTGETPRPYGVEPPRPRVEAVRIVDMSEFQFMGGIRGPVLRDAFGLPRP